jgi:hypothetical protein
MDPVEERDVEKVLQILDDPRVIEKIAKKLAIAGDATALIVPCANVLKNKEDLHVEG